MVCTAASDTVTTSKIHSTAFAASAAASAAAAEAFAAADYSESDGNLGRAGPLGPFRPPWLSGPDFSYAWPDFDTA